MKIIYTFVFIFFFSISSSYTNANDLKNLQNFNLQAEIFCKNLIKNSYLFLRKYSGLVSNKKLDLELKKCERFAMTFPIFITIIKDKYKDFFMMFLLIFCLIYFLILIKRKINVKRK